MTRGGVSPDDDETMPKRWPSTPPGVPASWRAVGGVAGGPPVHEVVQRRVAKSPPPADNLPGWWLKRQKHAAVDAGVRPQQWNKRLRRFDVLDIVTLTQQQQMDYRRRHEEEAKPPPPSRWLHPPRRRAPPPPPLTYPPSGPLLLTYPPPTPSGPPPLTYPPSGPLLLTYPPPTPTPTPLRYKAPPMLAKWLHGPSVYPSSGPLMLAYPTPPLTDPTPAVTWHPCMRERHRATRRRGLKRKSDRVTGSVVRFTLPN